MKCDCLPVEFDIMTDDDGWSPEIIAIVKKYALQNAVEYNGSGKSGSVLGRILGERTDLRSKAKELKKLVEIEVNIANNMALEDGVEAVRKTLEETNPEALNRQKQVKRVGLKLTLSLIYFSISVKEILSCCIESLSRIVIVLSSFV